MKKIFTLLCLAALMISTLTLAGCGSSTSEKKTVAVCFPGTTERWTTSGGSIEQELKESGFNVKTAYAKTAEEQAQEIEAAVNEQVACIVVAGVDSKALSDPLGKAKAKNIPVIAYDRLPMNTDAVSYYATFDNEGIGVAMAKYVEKKFNLKQGAGPYNIEFFQGSDDDNNAHLVDKGMMSVLKPYLDKGQLVVPSGQTSFAQTSIKGWDTKTAETRMKQLIGQYYSDGKPLHIVLSAADCLSYGIVDGLTAAGYQGPWPFITGQDAEQKSLSLVQKGQIGFTLKKSPELLNNKCIKMIKAVVEGSQPELNDLKTYNNGTITVPTYLCIPLIIDQENLTEAK